MKGVVDSLPAMQAAQVTTSEAGKTGETEAVHGFSRQHISYCKSDHSRAVGQGCNRTVNPKFLLNSRQDNYNCPDAVGADDRNQSSQHQPEPGWKTVGLKG